MSIQLLSTARVGRRQTNVAAFVGGLSYSLASTIAQVGKVTRDKAILTTLHTDRALALVAQANDAGLLVEAFQALDGGWTIRLNSQLHFAR